MNAHIDSGKKKQGLYVLFLARQCDINKVKQQKDVGSFVIKCSALLKGKPLSPTSYRISRELVLGTLFQNIFTNSVLQFFKARFYRSKGLRVFNFRTKINLDSKGTL